MLSLTGRIWATVVVVLALASPAVADDDELHIADLTRRALDGNVAADEFDSQALAVELQILQHGLEGIESDTVLGLLDAASMADPAYQSGLLRVLAQILASNGRGVARDLLSEDARHEIADTVTMILWSRDAQVRLNALKVLRNTRDDVVVEPVLTVLDDPLWSVRFEALAVLEPLVTGEKRDVIVDAVWPLVDDDDATVSGMARVLLDAADAEP